MSAVTRVHVLGGWRSAERAFGSVALGGVAFASTLALSASNGGFFPTSWGWAALGLFGAAIVGVVVMPITRPTGLELAYLGTATAIAGWTWLSIAWSSSPTQSTLEGERSLVLVAVVAAVLTLARGRAVSSLVGGVLGAILVLCVYALATRLFPDHFGYHPTDGYRLGAPIGYWNGLGLFAAMGTLLAAGLVLRAGHVAIRVLAAAAFVVLVPTLYFTFSRGSWLALGLGLVALVALDPRRLQVTASLLVLAPIPAVAVFVASRNGSLTRSGFTLSRAHQDGHRLAVLLLGLALLEVVLARIVIAAEERLTITRTVRTAFAASLLACVTLGLVGLVLREGNPVRLVGQGYASFTAPTSNETSILNQRLFTFSGNGRWTFWRVAWQEAQAHPLLGSGAGTFGQYWLQHRPVGIDIVDAHNLYLETLAELGPLGLALVVGLLSLPLLAAVRYRRHPLVPAAAGALVVYASGAAFDWDWELAGVTLAAVLTGMACLLAPRELSDASPCAGRGLRAAWLAPLVALAGLAALCLAGNVAVSRSRTAAGAGDFQTAAAHGRTATRWAPWSGLGWQALGEAQLRLHRFAAARTNLSKAIARDPRNWVLWLDLSEASKGSAKSAALHRALELNPLSNELRTHEDASGQA